MLEPTIKLQTDTRINIENNYTEFKQLLEETNREGVNTFISWLDETDCKIAPASTIWHLNIPGGLVQHSLNTWNYAHQLNEMLGLNLEQTSLIIASLLHDMCKINFYVIKEDFDKEYKQKTNLWRKKEMYGILDSFPLGHGEKSVIVILEHGLKLLPPEVLGIRHHMGFSDSESTTHSFKQAWNESALVKIIAMADQLADIYETHVFTSKKDEK